MPSASDCCPYASTLQSLAGIHVQGMSVIVKATNNTLFRPEKVDYYKQQVLPKMYGFAAVLVVALVLLVYWIVW